MGLAKMSANRWVDYWLTMFVDECAGVSAGVCASLHAWVRTRERAWVRVAYTGVSCARGFIGQATYKGRPINAALVYSVCEV